MSGATVEKSLIPDDPEDQKLITLARAALARTAAAQGACVRDTDGRAYAAAGVHLNHLKLSAVAVAVAMAVSSGATGLEAVAVVGAPPTGLGRRGLVCRCSRPRPPSEPVVTASIHGELLAQCRRSQLEKGYVSQQTRRRDPWYSLSWGRFAAQSSK